jgi:hypothetical protein
MAVKALLAALLAAAIGVGFLLPAPRRSETDPRSQIAQIEVGR